MPGSLVSVGLLPGNVSIINNAKHGEKRSLSGFDSDSDSDSDDYKDQWKTLSADTCCYAGTHNGKMSHLRKLTRPAFEALCSDIFWSRVLFCHFRVLSVVMKVILVIFLVNLLLLLRLH